MAIGRVGDSPAPVVTPPAQSPASGAGAPAQAPKTETANKVTQTSIPSSYERQGRGSPDQPKTDEGREIAAAKQQLLGALGALGPGGQIEGAPVEQRAQEIQGLLQKAGVPADKASTAGDVLKSYQAALAGGGKDASGLEAALERAGAAGVLGPSDVETVREIAYANLPEAAAANAAASSKGALKDAITAAEGGKLPDAAELRDLLERGGVEHKYAQAAANAVRHLERAEEAAQGGDAATVKAELGFLQGERAKAVKGGALSGQNLAALDAAVARLQGGSAAPATAAAPAAGTATSSTPAAAQPRSTSPIELSKELLAKAGAAAEPQLKEAASKAASGDFAGAFDALGRAGKTAAPEVVAEVASKIADRLPEGGAGGVARAVLKDKKAVAALAGDSALQAGVAKLAKGDLSAIKDIASAPSSGPVLDAALGSPPVKASLDKLGLTPADAKTLAKGVPDLIRAGTALGSGDVSGTLSALGDAAKQVGPEPIAKLVSKVGQTLPQTGAGGVARAILQDPKAISAVLTDSTLPASIAKLANGDLSALKDIAGAPGGSAVIDAALGSAPIKSGLDKLGLTAEDVKAAGRALPDLIRAGGALGKGDASGALQALGDAATHASPDAVTKAITKAAAALPETGALGVARALLTDQALVKKVLTNPETRKAYDAIASGKPEAAAAAVGTLFKDPSVRDAALGALANDKQLLSKLAPLGIKDAKDLKAVGASLGDLLGAEEAARAGNYGDALSQLGKAAKDLPPELRGRIAGALADRAHAPPWLKEALVGAAGLLDNPEVQKSLSGAFTALSKGNVGDLVTNLASAGKAIASAAPEVAAGFLNSLGKLPGSLGKLFQDKEFNTSLVKSGAVNELLDAASALAHGDLSGAASAVAGAGAKLLGEGEHFTVAGQQLPFGKKGIENLTRAFGRFVDALPQSVKTRITEEAVKLGAKAGLKSVPLLGNLINAGAAVGDAAELYSAIRANPPNTLNIALAAAQVGLDVAGVVPGLNSVTGPLGVVLGTAKVIAGGYNLVGDLKSFQNSLVSL